MKLSVIIPISERHDEIEEIYRDYKDALVNMGVEHEMIFVIDGYFEKAYQTLKSIRSRGEKLTIVKHATGFGEATAIVSGFKQSKGDMILTLPAYYQVDPAALPEMMKQIDGVDVVVARRWPREDSKMNQLLTKFFHFLVKFMTELDLNDIGCGIRMVKREVLQEVNIYGDLHRFLPILASKQGYKIREVELKQSEKEKRVRTHPLGVYIRRLIDLITAFFLVKFTKKPLRFFGLAGTAILVPGVAITMYLGFGRLLGKFPLSNRPLLLLGILMVVLGIQIFAIGLVGEIIIFTHARELKDYKIEEIIN